MYYLVLVPEFILKEEYDDIHSIEQVGSNSGNCVVWEAAKKILAKSNLKLITPEYLKNNKHITPQISKVAVVLANAIRQHTAPETPRFLKFFQGLSQPKKTTAPAPVLPDWVRMTHELIKDLNCEKHLLSIGARSRSLDYFEFTKEQKDLYLEYFSQFKHAYLRGSYTHNLLKYNGIDLPNCEPVGCPSILLKPIHIEELKSKFSMLATLSRKSVRVGINFPDQLNYPLLYHMFVNIMPDQHVYTLIQCNMAWVNFYRKKRQFPPKQENNEALSRNVNNFIYGDNCLEVSRFLESRVQLMIGTRIHGTILGLLSGVPSMCMVIDSRTHELCEQMGIPSIDCMNKAPLFNNREDLIDLFMRNFNPNILDKLGETIKENSKKYDLLIR